MRVGLGCGQLGFESIKLGLRNLRVLGLVGVQFSKRGLAGKGLQRHSQGLHCGGVGLDACGNGGQPVIHLPLVAGHQGDEFLALAPVQPDNGVEVGGSCSSVNTWERADTTW